MSENTHKRLTAARFIEAIRTSGGIKSVICKRGGFCIVTFQRALKKYPTVLAAYNAECDTMIDAAHSVVLENIALAAALQKKGEVVNTTDARWYLTRKGKKHGFGKDLPITNITVGVSLMEWRKQATERLGLVQAMEDE